MLNPHPPLSGFPIVLVCILALLEGIRLRSKNPAEWQRTLSFVILLLMTFVPLTYFSGYFGADYAHSQFKVPDEAILQHQLWAKSALFVSIGMTLIYVLAYVAEPEKPAVAKQLLSLYRFFLICLLVTLIRTGFLGGNLVFSHGAGVHVEEEP